MTASLISIVLPVHNQADHITEVVQQYEDALGRMPTCHELILVPNDCRDRSLETCNALADRYPPVRVKRSEGGGWGLAVRLGLKEAGGDLLCYTNGARTTAQELSLALLYALTFPNVVIKANRKIRENWRRRLGSLIYNLECRALFDLACWDINGTPKVFPRAFDALLRLTRDDDLIDAEFNVICRRENYAVIEVPIISTRRYGGRSTTNLRSAVRLYWGAYRLFRSERA